jgi:hypothetical protein
MVHNIFLFMMSPPLETGDWLSSKTDQERPKDALRTPSFILLDTVSREKLILIPLFPSIGYEVGSGISKTELFFMSFQVVRPTSVKGNP